MRLKEYARLERESLQRLLQRYEKLAAEMPEINFFQFKDGKRTRYYISTAGREVSEKIPEQSAGIS